MVLIVQGNQYQVNQFGMPIDGGAFRAEGNVVTSQSSYTGAMEQYRVTLEGDVLRMQDAWGGLWIYQRIQ